jgi:[ribosomal protein S5]-alanine N-acetyltransferase
MIATSHLTLRPPSDGSIPTVVGWLNDPETMRYSEQRHKHHAENLQSMHVWMMTAPPHKYREIHYGNALIGTISADVDEHNSVANVGILIGERKVWGKGYGTEAWKTFCDHLLVNGIRKIEAGCMGINFGMIHVFRKTGMHEEGKRSGRFVVGNELVDEVQFARFL